MQSIDRTMSISSEERDLSRKKLSTYLRAFTGPEATVILTARQIEEHSWNNTNSVESYRLAMTDELEKVLRLAAKVYLTSVIGEELAEIHEEYIYQTSPSPNDYSKTIITIKNAALDIPLWDPERGIQPSRTTVVNKLSKFGTLAEEPRSSPLFDPWKDYTKVSGAGSSRDVNSGARSGPGSSDGSTIRYWQLIKDHRPSDSDKKKLKKLRRNLQDDSDPVQASKLQYLIHHYLKFFEERPGDPRSESDITHFIDLHKFMSDTLSKLTDEGWEKAPSGDTLSSVYIAPTPVWNMDVVRSDTNRIQNIMRRTKELAKKLSEVPSIDPRRQEFATALLSFYGNEGAPPPAKRLREEQQ